MKVEVEYGDLRKLMGFLPDICNMDNDTFDLMVSVSAAIEMARTAHAEETPPPLGKDLMGFPLMPQTKAWFRVDLSKKNSYWNIIMVIKLVREVLNCGLKEAKDIVEQGVPFAVSDASAFINKWKEFHTKGVPVETFQLSVHGP